MNSDQSPVVRPPKVHNVTVIVASGLGNIPEDVLCEVLRRLPQLAGLPSRKNVMGCTRLDLTSEKALLEEEGAKSAKPSLLVHMIKHVRKLNFQPSGTGHSTSEYPISDAN